MDAEVKKEFNRLHDKINKLIAGQNKTTWISASFLSDLTGWDSERLRQARNQGIVEHKRSSGGGWLYRLESVPEQFIKKQTIS